MDLLKKRSLYSAHFRGLLLHLFPGRKIQTITASFQKKSCFFLLWKKMKIKWYLGLESALKENKITWQALNTVTIINNNFSGIKRLEIPSSGLLKQKAGLIWAIIKKKTNNSVAYFYSDPEKTYLDFLYFYSYSGKDINVLKKNLDFKVEKSKIIKYAKDYTTKIQEAI